MAVIQSYAMVDCYACKGAGTIQVFDGETITPRECSTCGGAGKYEASKIQTGEGIFPTYKILEATDPTEYVALAPGNVTLYKLIISAGIVDLGATTTARAVLWGMFGEGTTTRANLETLIS